MGANDVVFGMASLFIIAVLFFLGFYVGDVINESIRSVPQLNNTAGVREVLAGGDVAQSKLDFGFLVLFFGIAIGAVLSGWVVAGFPVFMFVYFLIVVLVVFFSVVLGQAWSDFVSLGTFAVALASFPITNFALLLVAL